MLPLHPMFKMTAEKPYPHGLFALGFMVAGSIFSSFAFPQHCGTCVCPTTTEFPWLFSNFSQNFAAKPVWERSWLAGVWVGKFEIPQPCPQGSCFLYTYPFSSHPPHRLFFKTNQYLGYHHNYINFVCGSLNPQLSFFFKVKKQGMSP